MCYGIANGSKLMNSQIFLKAFLCCLYLNPKTREYQWKRGMYQPRAYTDVDNRFLSLSKLPATHIYYYTRVVAVQTDETFPNTRY